MGLQYLYNDFDFFDKFLRHIYKIRFWFFAPLRPRLALKLTKSANKGQKSSLENIQYGLQKRRISCWFQFRWKCSIKIHTQKVISKTNWRTWVKWKSAYFRHVFVNNFFRMELLLEFSRKPYWKNKKYPLIAVWPIRSPPPVFSLFLSSVYLNTDDWLLLGRRKLPLIHTRDTRNRDKEKILGQTDLFNIWTIGLGILYGQTSAQLNLRSSWVYSAVFLKSTTEAKLLWTMDRTSAQP